MTVRRVYEVSSGSYTLFMGCFIVEHDVSRVESTTMVCVSTLYIAT